MHYNTMHSVDYIGLQFIISDRLHNYCITFGLFLCRLTFTWTYFAFTHLGKYCNHKLASKQNS